MCWWIVQNALVSGLLAAVVALVCRGARLSPAVKHALWLLVLVKLITPPLPWYQLPRSWDDRLARWSDQTIPAVSEQAEPRWPKHSPAGNAFSGTVDADAEVAANREFSVPSELIETSPPLASAPAFDRWVPGSTIAHDESPVAVKPRDHTAVGRLWQSANWVVAVGWLIGTLALAIVQSSRLIQLWHWLRQSTAAPPWLDRLVRQAAGRLGIHPPEVAVTSVLCSPLVCALGRPRLLWPAALSDQLSREAREAVVLHELAHLRRRDHWVAWLELAAGMVWWFNPLYWYARHQLRENAELACDAWVVGLLPSGRRAYAQALIEVTEFVSFAAAASPAVAMGNVARRTLERRLTMILRERIAYRVPLVGTGLIGLSLLVVLPGWSRGQVADAISAVETTPAQKPVGADDSVADPNQTPALAAPEDPFIVAEEPVDAARFRVAFETTSAEANSAAGEDRIRQLEAKLTQLLGEVQALRSGAPEATNRPNTPANVRIRTQLGQPSRDGSQERLWAQSVTPSYRAHVIARAPRLPGARDYEVETLTRAKYKLPEATAKALAAFIQEHVKSDVETKVDGDVLSVTASNEDQMRIAGFVELLREREKLPGRPANQKAGLPSLPTIEEKKTSALDEPVPDLVIGSDARLRTGAPAVRAGSVGLPLDVSVGTPVDSTPARPRELK